MRPLSRRATDLPIGSEIVRFIVDADDCVKFGRTSDDTRISPEMQWPDVMDRDVVDVVPEPQREQLARLLAEVRAGRHPAVWQFESVMRPGEWRALYAQPVSGHPGWVGIAVFAMAAEAILPGGVDQGQAATGTDPQQQQEP